MQPHERRLPARQQRALVDLPRDRPDWRGRPGIVRWPGPSAARVARVPARPWSAAPDRWPSPRSSRCIAGVAPLACVRGRARNAASSCVCSGRTSSTTSRSAVRAGLSLPEALAQLGDRGPMALLRAAFDAFADEYRVNGRFGDCLDQLKADLADPVGDRVVEALRLARDVGGNDLGRLLRTLSAIPARRRPHARRAGEPAGLDGERCAARGRGAVDRARASVSASAKRSTPTTRAAGLVVLSGGAVVCVVAYRLMVRIGAAPRGRTGAAVTPAALALGSAPPASRWRSSGVAGRGFRCCQPAAR